MNSKKRTDRDANLSTATKKMCPEVEKDRTEAFIPRDYQIEILESAKKGNTIACLGTGTGKTFIAVMLIREVSHQVLVPFEEGGKRIFFLVPTVPLVQQQADVISKHTELKVGRYFGEMNVDMWDKNQWIEEFKAKQVLVMTAEICRNILNHSFMSPSEICLLVFDECHRAQGKHPYREIMKTLMDYKDRPLIFGLSASLLNKKCAPRKLRSELKNLENTLGSKIVTANDYNEVQKYGTDPDEVMVIFKEQSEFSDGACCDSIQQIYVCIKDLLSSLKKQSTDYATSLTVTSSDSDIYFFKKPQQCAQQLLDILKYFGPWCTYRAAKTFYSEAERLEARASESEKASVWSEVKKAVRSVIDICKKHNYHVFETTMNKRSHKLERLLELFNAFGKLYYYNQKESLANSIEPSFNNTPLEYLQYLGIKNSENSLESFVCSIIFVEQRIIAHVLCQWLEEIAKQQEEFRFIKPSYIIGHGTVGSNETAMNVAKQRGVVKDFREKKSNVLIATSVLEEGLDVQKCNLVVRLDFPKDFRSYLQSRGRARAQLSKYVLFISEEEYTECFNDLMNFKVIESMIINNLDESDVPSKEEIEKHLNDDLITPYAPVTAAGTPRITLSSATGLLYRYCALLPSDMATKLLPRYKIEKVEKEYTKAKEDMYICYLQLPINSPLRKSIVGPPMKTKKSSKMAAALEACKMLHEIGELNDYLLPNTTAVEDAFEELLGDEEKETTESGEGQPGTNKRKQVYKKGIASYLSSDIPTAGSECYLHIFLLTLVSPLTKSLNLRGRPIVDPADTTKGFGLLCKRKIPRVCRFPIFTKVGKIMCELLCIDSPLTLETQEIIDIRKFHEFFFKDASPIKEENLSFLPEESEFSVYIVPVDKLSTCGYAIDWNFLFLTLNHSYNEEKLKTKTTVKRTKFEKELFTDAVVTRSYLIDWWKMERPVFQCVNKICYDMSPLSLHPEFGSWDLYMQDKYAVVIEDKNQPILNVERFQNWNLSKPIYVSLKKDGMNKLKRQNFVERLIPELCIIHPFPGYMFRKATYIPTVLYRLNQLLLAEQLRQAVSAEVSVGLQTLPEKFTWPDFNFEKSDEKLRVALAKKGEIPSAEVENVFHPADILKCEGEIISFEVKMDLIRHPGPNPSTLLQAMTTTSACDEFNLERLETIGDSFLKYAMSIKIYTSYPTFDEGKLTLLRMKLIRNLNLYQASKKKELPESLFHTPFDSANAWLPPCYVSKNSNCRDALGVSKPSDKESGTNSNENIDNITCQIISDKCVADSVEALIGSYLLSCGYEGALRFMYWLGPALNPYVSSPGDKKVNFSNWPPKVADPIIEDLANHPHRISREGKFRLLNGFEEFEKRINYKFKEPAYLLQAFTHPSYSDNCITDCYQRLEFLGDAVLDYLITRKLYDDPKGHSPGELTDLRSALVNNVFFASLAVKYGYHKNLKILSTVLFNQINRYIELLQDSEDFKFFTEYGYYLEEIECFDTDEVEVPKALGDIFESVAGAIYVDSGMSLDAVWKICYPMMKDSIDHLCDHVPKSPVRELFEIVNDKNIFQDHATDESNRMYMLVRLPDGKEFVGVGPNKKVAKKSAAKRALSYLKKKKKSS